MQMVGKVIESAVTPKTIPPSQMEEQLLYKVAIWGGKPEVQNFYLIKVMDGNYVSILLRKGGEMSMLPWDETEIGDETESLVLVPASVQLVIGNTGE